MSQESWWNKFKRWWLTGDPDETPQEQEDRERREEQKEIEKVKPMLRHELLNYGQIDNPEHYPAQALKECLADLRQERDEMNENQRLARELKDTMASYLTQKGDYDYEWFVEDYNRQLREKETIQGIIRESEEDRGET